MWSVVSERRAVLQNVLLRGSYHLSMKNLLGRLAVKFIDLQCRRECIFNVTFDPLTKYLYGLDENLRLDFNSDRKMLGFLVFANEIFKGGVSCDMMTYDLVLTYQRFAGN